MKKKKYWARLQAQKSCLTVLWPQGPSNKNNHSKPQMLETVQIFSLNTKPMSKYKMGKSNNKRLENEVQKPTKADRNGFVHY